MQCGLLLRGRVPRNCETLVIVLYMSDSLSYQCCLFYCIGECWACQWTCMLPVMLPLSDLQSNSWKHDGGFYIMYVCMYVSCLHIFNSTCVQSNKPFSSWTFIFHMHYHCVVVSICIIFCSLYVGGYMHWRFRLHLLTFSRKLPQFGLLPCHDCTCTILTFLLTLVD